MAQAKAPSPKVAFSTRLSTDVYLALTAHADKTGKTKEELVDKALRKHLKLPAK